MKKTKLKNDFDIKFLDGLVNDKNSCVSIQSCNHHLALHPYHLNDLTQSIKDILSTGISKYDSKLDGILFGYKNIKLLSNVGAIVDDACFIHIDINADFFIFKPKIGCTLTGIANKKSKDHVGCLVHKLFNVSIPKLENQKSWLGQDIILSSEIELKITHTDFEGRLPYIRAEIVSILSQPEETISQSTKIRFDDDEDNDYQEDIEDESMVIINDRKVFVNQDIADLNDTSEVKMKKKKLKTPKKLEESVEEVPSKKVKKSKKIKIKTEPETDTEIMSPAKIKKEKLDETSNSKKRKLSFSEENEESESASPKKKRKSSAKSISEDSSTKKSKKPKKPKIKREVVDDDNESLPDLDLSRLFDTQTHHVDLDLNSTLNRSMKRTKSEIELPLIHF